MKKRPRRIDQMLPSYAEMDAVGTHVRSIRRLLKARGFESEIFFEIHRDDTAKESQHYSAHKKVSSEENIVIYHHSIGSGIPYYLTTVQDYVVTLYHNITPPEYFSHLGDWITYEACSEGLRQLDLLRTITKTAWTVSQYNAKELIEKGFPEPSVFPLLRDYKHLSSIVTDSESFPAWNTSKNTLLFVGRISPHKGQHDLIMLTKALQEVYKQDVRLVMIGGANQEYLAQLKAFTKKLGLTLSDSLQRDADIIIPGQVSDSVLARMYKMADCFICFSDHEGFCVPLVEAMFLGLPLVVHDSSAVAETCSNAGLVVNKRNPESVLPAVHEIISQKALASSLRSQALKRANDFTWDSIVDRFDHSFQNLLKDFEATFSEIL